jgi:hypothetical protein
LGKSNRNVLFESCPLIKDFRSLREVPKIEIKRCYGFTKGYSVSGAKIIILDRCNNISDVSRLKNAGKVEFRSCDGITSLEGLENVPEIVIENCQNLNSLQGLGMGRNEYITLEYEIDDEPEAWEKIHEDDGEEEEERDNSVSDENERTDKDNRDVKPFQPHPLVEDPVLNEYYQLIGSYVPIVTGRSVNCFGKKRTVN